MEDLTHTDHASVSGDAPEVPMLPLLTVVHHVHEAFVGRRVLLRDGATVAIGRGGDCFGAGVLEDSRISRRHLEIVRRGQRVVAVDAGGKNGSFVNGQRLERQELELGDVVAVGGVVCLYHRGPVFHEVPRHPTILGVGHAVARLLTRIERAAAWDVTVLVQGETGTGKELVARALHEASPRPGAFVAVNCGALSDGVVHSELFGHARGAFSGAGQARAGLVQAAVGGTLFLDEIGDASPTLQASLLRLLESGEYRQVGSDRELRADVRFVAATHVPLEGAVLAGGFREDLLGRLDRFVIAVPPLRDRPEDVLPIARHALGEMGRGDMTLARPLCVALLRYTWPRNVRELWAVVQQAVVESRDGTLRLSDSLAARLELRATPAAAAPEKPTAEWLWQRLGELEGNVKALAGELGVARTTAYRWLRAAGIDPEQMRR